MRRDPSRLAIVALAAGLVLGAGGAARAADPAARAAAEASFERAERAAQQRRFAEALASYREALAEDPSAPASTAARARITDLEAHAEGGFAPLARLEDLRRDPRRGGDRAEVEALERECGRFATGRFEDRDQLVSKEFTDTGALLRSLNRRQKPVEHLVLVEPKLSGDSQS